MNHAKSLLLLALALPLAACDVFDMPQESETGDDPMPEPDEDPEPSDGEESGGEESGGEESGGEESGGTDEGTAHVPAGILGLWYATGGGIASLELKADGTYIDANRAETTLGYCTTVWELTSAGDYIVIGNELHLHPTSGHKRIDECGTVEESNDVPSARAYAWELGVDEYGETLTLTDEYGPIPYHRE